MIWLLAIAALIIAIMYPRQVGIVVLILGLVVVSFISDQLEKAEQLQQKEKRVNITAKIDYTSCSDNKHPLLVTIENKSGETVTFTKFGVSAYRKNYSSRVLLGSYKTDRIIPNGESWRRCWEAPSGYTHGIPLDELIWDSSIYSVKWN